MSEVLCGIFKCTMTEHNSHNDFSSAEIKYTLDFYSDEQPQNIGILENYVAAKSALHGLIDDLMLGKGESSDEIAEHITAMLGETAKGYAAAVQTVDKKGEQCQFGAQLLTHSLTETQNVLEKFNTEGFSIDIEDTDELTNGYHTYVDNLESTEEISEVFEQVYGGLYQNIINVLSQYAPDNENDLRRQKRDQLKAHVLDGAKDAAKIALGAAAAIAVTGFLKRK